MTQLIQTIATYGANEHINFHCLELEHEAKLRRWREVYESLLAALMLYQDTANARRHEELMHVCVN